MNYKAIEILAKRGEKYDVMVALSLLTKAYIEMCGISLGNRTVVYCAAEPWQERLAWLDLPLSIMARKEPFVHLMPHISKDYVPEEYDDYDITGMSKEELLDVCNQIVWGKEFDVPTLEVLCWGILKATEDEKLLEQKIETAAPDGTSLKGILEQQKCSGTWLTMTSPYVDLNTSKGELVRDPRELLVGAYNDYLRLHKQEEEIRSLYYQYQLELRKLDKMSAWNEHKLFKKIFGMILNNTVLVSPKRLFHEWFGLKFEYEI